MARLRDVVRWLRPAGAPGAAAPAGIPVDRADEANAELAPVFAALEPAMATAADLLARAAEDAEEIHRRGAGEVEARLADAHRRAEVGRAAAAARAVESSRDERDGLLAGARAEAATISSRAEERLPDLVARVVRAVQAIDTDREPVR
jgi:hypothetical protein